MSTPAANTTIQDAAYFKQLCDSAGLALLAVDQDGTVCYANRQAEEIFGMSSQQVVGRPIGTVVGPERREMVDRLLQRAIRRDMVHHLEFRYADDTGKARYLAATLSPIHDASSTAPIGASVCIGDITRRIKEQEQVGQARKMRALGALAGNLAHHFNNILGSVVTGVDFAKESHDPRLLKKTLQVVARALQRATRLLDGLLAFAEADYRDADLADLTETTLHFAEGLAPQLAGRGIELDLRISQVPVMAVPLNRFLTVLRNITDNAVDAMSEGGRLVIELEPDPHCVVCRITDSGRGIRQEQLEHVFEPFYSTKKTAAAADTEHPGLGLSAAMGIVHELGGEILITSRPGNQTVVEIRLPIDPQRPLYVKEDHRYR